MGENVNWNDVKSVIIDGNKVTNFSIDSSSIDGISTFEISGIYSPETLIIDTDTTSRHDEIKNKIKEMEKEKGDNMERINNILNLYKEHQIREFDRQCNEDIEFIRKTSVLANVTEKLRKQAKKELEKLYPDKDYEDIKYYIYLGYENDKKTQEAINERLDYRKEQIEKLERNLDDIKALIAIAETFDEKMQILKNYEVIDEGGKIKSW